MVLLDDLHLSRWRYLHEVSGLRYEQSGASEALLARA